MLKLTATLHKEEKLEDVVFKYSLRKAITDGHLADYQIVCKIFDIGAIKSDEKFENVVKYQNKLMNQENLKRCIGYCRNLSDKGKGKTNLDQMQKYDTNEL